MVKAFTGGCTDIKLVYAMSLKAFKIVKKDPKDFAITYDKDFTLRQLVKEFGGVDLNKFTKPLGLDADKIASIQFQINAGYKLATSITKINDNKAELYGKLKITTCSMQPTFKKAARLIDALQDPKFKNVLEVLGDGDFVNKIKNVFMDPKNKEAINALKGLKSEAPAFIKVFMEPKYQVLINDILTTSEPLGEIFKNSKYKQYQAAIDTLNKPQIINAIDVIKTSGTALKDILTLSKYKALFEMYTNEEYSAIYDMLTDKTFKDTLDKISTSNTGLDVLFEQICIQQFPKTSGGKSGVKITIYINKMPVGKVI